MNREIFPAVLYPLVGDVQSQAGNQAVEVVGILSVPIVQSLNLSGQVLEYNLAQNSWVPTLRASIQVNGMTVSDDYLVSINVVKEILVNGS
jgi:hypothetical protein